ncbi:hypothetical protein RGQ15_11600 [Paracoccus sp. MBLB3053]|uniref:Uncharacterized protein n=1 Tax=Paracoccus aurantius TaxID=3073814 RepID=A0ABU2HT39_9RHOB|nr:hypothetical protein [Paracoccus sp. MBLB3053]MDS9468211.1 hypothetical protein [Paracoccus sp. MBLB3053]
MQMLTGEVIVQHQGVEYRLMLGLRGIAKLQDQYGARLDPIRNMGQGEDEIPDFNVLLNIVDIALERHHPNAGADLSEHLLIEDMALPGKLLKAAFPEAKPAASKPAGDKPSGKAKARR